MIEIKMENEEINKKVVTGEAAVIITQLACIIDSVIDDIVLATNNEKTKVGVLDFMHDAIKNCWGCNDNRI